MMPIIQSRVFATDCECFVAYAFQIRHPINNGVVKKVYGVKRSKAICRRDLEGAADPAMVVLPPGMSWCSSGSCKRVLSC